MIELEGIRARSWQPTENDLRDESNNVGYAEKVVQFRPDADPVDIADVLFRCDQEGTPVWPAGARSSLTRAVVPNGGWVLDMSKLTGLEIGEDEKGHFATVQPGVSLRQLEDALHPNKLFFPSAPTWKLATVAGTLACHGAGALNYKYGPTRNWVEAMKLVLPSGEIWDIESGQYMAQPADEEYPSPHFKINGRNIPALTYKPPDVRSIAAGYYPSQDFLKMVLGSEGTLFVIAEAKLRLKEQPDSYICMVECGNDQQLFELNEALWNQEPEKRETLEPGGLAAVEFVCEDAYEVVEKHPLAARFEEAEALLLAQVEGDESLDQFAAICEQAGAGQIHVVDSYDPPERRQAFFDLREKVPEMVNSIIRENKVKKMAADICVMPEQLPEMAEIFTSLFAARAIRKAKWGHGEGKLHVNSIADNIEQLDAAQEAVVEGAKEAAKRGGSALGEHGVGKNEAKQELVVVQYGQGGVNQQRAVKRVIDPNGTMAPGNIFPV